VTGSSLVNRATGVALHPVFVIRYARSSLDKILRIVMDNFSMIWESSIWKYIYIFFSYTSHANSEICFSLARRRSLQTSFVKPLFGNLTSSLKRGFMFLTLRSSITREIIFYVRANGIHLMRIAGIRTKRNIFLVISVSSIYKKERIIIAI